jgi:4-hydroxy 2-oxovalerate aldolase
MGKISLLDCTLRDGGYVNDWHFGSGTISAIYNRLLQAGVDIIEVGFLDDRRIEDMNYSIQPCTESYNRMFSTEIKKSIVVAMIDYGTCSIDNIQKCEDTFLDGIRLIFKKEKAYDALDYAKLLKDKGYIIFLQMVSITSYSEQDVIDFTERVNLLKPNTVSIVDTYGLMHKQELFHYFKLLDNYLSNDITIGYHSHNNFQLAYSNSIELISEYSDRDIVIDGTIYGMGKSAGNAPLELLAMYLNDNHSKKYDITQIIEAIDNNIYPIYMQKQWGYSMLFYISALNDCHPNYVENLLKKKTLSIKSINDIVSNIHEPYKLHYNAQHIESLYQMYQFSDVDDKDAILTLKDKINGSGVLIIGPGRSIIDETDSIVDHIRQNKPIVIAANCYTELYDFDYVLFSNSKRYNLMCSELQKIKDKLIITSNITPILNSFKYILDYRKLAYVNDKSMSESVLSITLNLMALTHPKEIALAGFDGFSDKLNYYDDSLNMGVINDYEKINADLEKIIKEYMTAPISFITKSIYSR